MSDTTHDGTAHGDDLTGRTAIVTGGSRGIGLAIAAALLQRGANVVLTSRRQESAEAAARSFSNARVAGFGAHATDTVAAQACADFTVDRFGTLDILVNNAGTNPAFGPVTEQDQARFTKTFEVNLWAPILWTKVALAAGLGQRAGAAIVNNASVGGLLYEPGLGVYNASKAALIHLTGQLALELAPAVRVNAVAPGVVRTRLSEALWKQREEAVAGSVPLRRLGEPTDVAAAVAFLASDAASWLTGETLVVDGGQRLGGSLTAPAHD